MGLNKKALLLFLGLTFGITLSTIAAAYIAGFTLIGTPAIMSQVVILVAMFIPSISAIIVQRTVLKKPLKELGLTFGPRSMYVKTYGVIFIIYLVNYALTWLFLLPPDWTLTSFIGQFTATDPSFSLPIPAPQMLLIMAGTTFLLAPILNMIPSLGEEIGWRGFLLPALEPLGKVKAAVVASMIWAIWHTPMIILLGFGYGAQAWPGAILHFITVTGFGIWMAYTWFKTRSTILSGFMHATFNAHAYGIWTLLFVSGNKLLIGPASVIGAALCLMLGLVTLNLMARRLDENIDDRIKISY